MAASLLFMRSSAGNISQGAALKSSGAFRFCTGRCQDTRPPEGGVELSPGRWRCGACWIEMARKRQ
jgi:hypothetical protein